MTSGDRSDRSVAKARHAGRIVAALRIPNLGIVAITAGGLDAVDRDDFPAVGVDSALPTNLEIRTSRGTGPDRNSPDDEIENSVLDADEFV